MPPPPPPWTVTSILERSYALARDNFAAFFTVAVIFGAVSLVMNILSLGPVSYTHLTLPTNREV